MKQIITTTTILKALLSSSSLKTPILYEAKSDTMMPSIEIGDYVYTDPQPDSLAYGDIIVYNCKLEESFHEDILCFRIVGLPGDSISVKDEIPVVNGKKNQIRKTNSPPYISNRVGYDKYEERLPNDIKINIYRERNLYYPIDIETTYIPDDHYFVMGDRRGKVYDSRFTGAIGKDQILGRVVEIQKI